MNIRFIVPIIALIMLSASSCVNNSEEELYGLECDTTNLSYSDIKYIFENNCYSCHSVSSSYYHYIVLTSKDKVEKAIKDGKLLPAINHTGEFKMPKDRTEKLDDCLIAKIEAWVKDGMP